ncbi:insulin-induced protein [Durotheca rogersii]|uniref:insulin-induced protein n=1 Tax=Durotheca rogersii TaxID=419775 RepID=UPI00221EFDEF|nr:insulin-induced protein [Durotheca rogersii]KAI5860553.1 insulin-induced protein [Durotheca rogersii]
MSTPLGDGPPLLRPIPRRPFDRHYAEPTPPEDDIPPADPSRGPGLNLESLNSRLLDSSRNNSFEPAPVSRAPSALNLTGSTLMGIFTPTTYGKDKFYLGYDEPSTPWGTGAETPAKWANTDDLPYETQKQRLRPTSNRPPLHPSPPSQPLSASQFAFYVGFRILLLSGLGMLYGIVIAQLQGRHNATPAFHVRGVLPAAAGYSGWEYTAFWGVFSVLTGTLLPWFDDIWEKAFGQDGEAAEPASKTMAVGEGGSDKSDSPIDWPLAIRGIGAFVGIAFAIKRLPWDSTLQVSLTLALANPVLWFLLDRSIPGFLFSTMVGVGGAAVLMGLKPDIVPIPTSPSVLGEFDQRNATGGEVDQLVFGGLASQETVATVIWMLSVLFCCCVCFGNIGRWLAPNRSAPAKGRWAQRR